MASGSAEDDRWRRRGGRRCELEEGEFEPAQCQSETDTEEYYNRHSPSESDETVSDCDRETSPGVVVVPAAAAAAPARPHPSRWDGASSASEAARDRPPWLSLRAPSLSNPRLMCLRSPRLSCSPCGSWRSQHQTCQPRPRRLQEPIFPVRAAPRRRRTMTP
jgi:hypothetical protein